MHLLLLFMAVMVTLLICKIAMESGKNNDLSEFSKRIYFCPQKYFRINFWKAVVLSVFVGVACAAILNTAFNIKWSSSTMMIGGTALLICSLWMLYTCRKSAKNNILLFNNGKVKFELYTNNASSITVLSTDIRNCTFSDSTILINGTVEVLTFDKVGRTFVVRDQVLLESATIQNLFLTSNNSICI